MLALAVTGISASETEAEGETDGSVLTTGETGEDTSADTEDDKEAESGDGTESDGSAKTGETTGDTTSTDKTKEINWDLIVTLAVIGIALIVFFSFYLFKPAFREKVKKFFRDYKSELKKIVWSPARDVKKNTIVVIIIAVVFALIIGGLDILFSKGIGSLTDLIIRD
ncbi:MAG: preprotein translocase subunit SecE [Clostridia bacterium]|nr:preprotein translocase subunit SecE [Clostridia bacterium]